MAYIYDTLEKRERIPTWQIGAIVAVLIQAGHGLHAFMPRKSTHFQLTVGRLLAGNLQCRTSDEDPLCRPADCRVVHNVPVALLQVQCRRWLESTDDENVKRPDGTGCNEVDYFAILKTYVWTWFQIYTAYGWKNREITVTRGITNLISVAFRPNFLPRCIVCNAVFPMAKVSVRLSVTRVNCDKTNESSADILTPYERKFIYFFEHKRMVGGRYPLVPEILGQTVGSNWPTQLQKRRFPIYIRW